MKCVIVVDSNLPVGLIANASAVLAMSIGNHVKGIIGEDAKDRDGTLHRGITQTVVPVLKGNDGLIRTLRDRLLQRDRDDLFFVDFCDVAQRSVVYDQYVDRLSSTPAKDLGYLGIAIIGPDKAVNSLTGHIGLLR